MLEDKLERLSGEVPDAKLLQAAMESDKVAAARAISQNTQLKEQLHELQNAFIKLVRLTYKFIPLFLISLKLRIELI